MSQRFKLPRSITAKTWAGLHSGLWRQPPRGLVARDDGTIAPAWTCREAISVIRGVRDALPHAYQPYAMQLFPLWYQFAAIAYGWDPSRDILHASRSQADSYYPADAAVLLHAELQRITGDLDDAGVPDPRIDMDPGAFDDPEFRSSVQRALQHDGALAVWGADDGARVGEDDATAKMPVPLPACKDPKTGKPVMPKLNPKTGKLECPGGIVVIDDPITAIVKSLATVAVPLAIILIAVAMASNRRRS